MVKLVKFIFQHWSWKFIQRIIQASDIVDVILEEAAILFNLLFAVIFWILHDCVDTIVSGSWNWDWEKPVVSIIKVNFHSERNRFLAFEWNLNFYFLFSHTQICAFKEINFDIDIWKLLYDHVLDVDIFISAVYYLEGWLWLFIQADNGQNYIRLVEIKSGVTSRSLHRYFEVLLVCLGLLCSFSFLILIDEKLQVFDVLSLCIAVEEYFDVHFLKSLKSSLVFFQAERVNIWIVNPPIDWLFLRVSNFQNFVLLERFQILFNDYFTEINFLFRGHQSIFNSSAWARLLKLWNWLVAVKDI